MDMLNFADYQQHDELEKKTYYFSESEDADPDRCKNRYSRHPSRFMTSSTASSNNQSGNKSQSEKAILNVLSSGENPSTTSNDGQSSEGNDSDQNQLTKSSDSQPLPISIELIKKLVESRQLSIMAINSSDRNQITKGIYLKFRNVLICFATEELMDLKLSEEEQDKLAIIKYRLGLTQQKKENCKYQRQVASCLFAAKLLSFNEYPFNFLYDEFENERYFIRACKEVLANTNRRFENGQEFQVDTQIVEFASVRILKHIKKFQKQI